MSEKFEPVLEVTEYHDGPRVGIAHFNGRPHQFRSRYLDATEYKGEYESVDIFELIAIGASGAAPITLAHGKFRPAVGQDTSPPGTIRVLEVSWQVIEGAK